MDTCWATRTTKKGGELLHIMLSVKPSPQWAIEDNDKNLNGKTDKMTTGKPCPPSSISCGVVKPAQAVRLVATRVHHLRHHHHHMYWQYNDIHDMYRQASQWDLSIELSISLQSLRMLYRTCAMLCEVNIISAQYILQTKRIYNTLCKCKYFTQWCNSSPSSKK